MQSQQSEEGKLSGFVLILKTIRTMSVFAQAVKKGLGRNQGLYFPKQFPKFDDIDAILAMPFVQRSVEILARLTDDELPRETLKGVVERAFAFGAPLAKSR